MTKHKPARKPAHRNFIKVELWDADGGLLTYENDVVFARISETPNPAAKFVVQLNIHADAKQNGKTTPAERWSQKPPEQKHALDTIGYGRRP